jgi:hypothetical protein
LFQLFTEDRHSDILSVFFKSLVFFVTYFCKCGTGVLLMQVERPEQEKTPGEPFRI